MRDPISTVNMKWTDINSVSTYTSNTEENKGERTKKTASIIWGAIQLTENFLKAIKQLNAYDASSIIKSEATWIQKQSFDEFLDNNKKKVTIEIGRVYYLDFGKTYKGELSYHHYGLCVGKRDGKILIVPITSGEKYRTSCYHPIQNPKASKKSRQGLTSEGFSKDCVLLLNDTKYISAGRIEKIDNMINQEALDDIQKTLFSVIFPQFKIKYDKLINENEKI
ncbi:hypothetical protein, partial [Anaerotignum sp.]